MVLYSLFWTLTPLFIVIFSFSLAPLLSRRLLIILPPPLRNCDCQRADPAAVTPAGPTGSLLAKRCSPSWLKSPVLFPRCLKSESSKSSPSNNSACSGNIKQMFGFSCSTLISWSCKVPSGTLAQTSACFWPRLRSASEGVTWFWSGRPAVGPLHQRSPSRSA